MQEIDATMPDMSSLTAAHRGYGYQDLLIACRFVDVLLGAVKDVHVDEKLVADDRFDDLTTLDFVGCRERTQFKHTDHESRPLTFGTFSNDARGLRLDRVFASMLADRDGPGRGSSKQIFRVVLRDHLPTDPKLTAVLTRTGADPGPFVRGMSSTRLHFDPGALWSNANESGAFAFLLSGEDGLSRDDLEWTCRSLVIEVAAPPFSGDLTDPKGTERILLTRAREDIGAGLFPNTDRVPIDVAAAMISAAQAARQGTFNVTESELTRRTQLRRDFGAVSRAHPVDEAVEVLRTSVLPNLVETATEAAGVGGNLLIVGPPGQGKSWVCKQMLDQLANDGWLTAEHYCFLGDADAERLDRVLAEKVFGSLVGRLAEADPTLLVDHRPRFAANEDALLGCLRRSLATQPDRPIALIVDGLDHITRIRSPRGGTFDPSAALTEILASLSLPEGSVLIVLSQPGKHLEALEEDATRVDIPGLAEDEVELLAARLGVVPGGPIDVVQPILEDVDDVADFLTALVQRSRGNALYATYLCREAARSDGIDFDLAAAVRALPEFDGDLKSYYEHLYGSLGSDAFWVADVIALIDFGVSRSELREIRPDAAHRVDDALDVLAPVLVERAADGGVRIYHESFARFLRQPLTADDGALVALLNRIAAWLECRGLFDDSRAFRSLLTVLTEAGQHERVVELVDRDFAVHAIAAGFPASAITANLATAIRCAARLERWQLVVRYVELSRAAEAYQTERFDSTLVEFADIPIALLGANAMSSRLLHDDRLVMPARAGLQMCAAVDALGAVAPWRHYMEGFLREQDSDDTSYGEASDRAVSLAWLRGRLRLAPTGSVGQSETLSASGDNRTSAQGWNPTSPLDWETLARWVVQRDLDAPEVVSVVYETRGVAGVRSLVEKLDDPGSICLAFAEKIAADPGSGDESEDPGEWAAAAAKYGVSPGETRRLLALGVDASDISPDFDRDRLLDLTREVQSRSVRWAEGQIGEWLDACGIAAHNDPLGLDVAEALVVGEGWYRCWLRFAIELSRAEVAEAEDRSTAIVSAVQRLTEDLNPFAGEPRSCDLFSIHGDIEVTIRRALELLDDTHWVEVVNTLKHVSESISTTLFGELGGPLPADVILHAAVDGVTEARREAVTDLVSGEIEHGSANRFYTDLAEYRLIGARLALALDDRHDAERLWFEACGFLTGYGWHKDVTIYEVLDPLPTLIDADPARGRVRVARVQPLCERVPLHTDKKETQHAWERWWVLLAAADPVALAHMVVPQLLRECNDPNWLLNAAIRHLWQAWSGDADELVAAALRLALESPMERDDRRMLTRLAAIADSSPDVRLMMTWLLARADERPVSYAYSNGDELLAKDDLQVSELNSVATASGLRPVTAIRDAADQQNRPPWKREATSSGDRFDGNLMPEPFPPGTDGIARAVRAWRDRPYDTTEPGWSVDRFANVVGYRLIELMESGLEELATAALRSLGDMDDRGDWSAMFRSIAAGLDRFGYGNVAALAYAMAWTRTRGRGGWLTFGGESELTSLRRASELDSDITNAVVAGAVERVVATGRYGTYGISQALVYAFGLGALASRDQSSIDTAFAAWDEAFAVIEQRAPRVHSSDEPDDQYRPPSPDDGAVVPGDLNDAMALATVGLLAHPARENKRRALLATQVLISERISHAANALSTACDSLSDPLTLTWLLRLMERVDLRSTPKLAAATRALEDLALGDRLTVRSLARRVLREAAPPLPNPETPDRSLLGDQQGENLWLPDGSQDPLPDESTGLPELVDEVAGPRLRDAERYLHGMTDAVLVRLDVALENEAHNQRLKAQLDAFGYRTEKRWPDALLAHEQTIEETIQRVAASGRAARMMQGESIADPAEWEDDLAGMILNDPDLPLQLEARRESRPFVQPPQPPGDAVWRRTRNAAVDGAAESIVAAADDADLLRATLRIVPALSAPVLGSGPLRDWHWLAVVERRRFSHPDYDKRGQDLIAERYQVVEVRDRGDQEGLVLPPIAYGGIDLWITDTTMSADDFSFRSSQPILGVDEDLAMIGGVHQGLGVQKQILTPTPALLLSLNLRPGEPFVMDDASGPGLALVLWRTDYATSDYHLPRPRIHGSGIAIRPDLLTRLDSLAADRLVLRDFVVGSSGLDPTEPEEADDFVGSTAD